MEEEELSAKGKLKKVRKVEVAGVGHVMVDKKKQRKTTRETTDTEPV
jgi:hypothetical protein